MPFRTEAGLHVEQLLQAAHEQQRAHQQHQRERHLRGHQRATQSVALAPRGGTAPARAHRRRRRDPRGPQRRQQAEQQAGANGHRRRETKHPQIRPHADEDRVICGAQKFHQPTAQDLSQRDAQRRAQHRQQQTLRQQLHDQPSARCADRLAYRHLALAHAGPRQQQIRQVGTRDQQHQPGCREQQRQRTLVLLDGAPILPRPMPRQPACSPDSAWPGPGGRMAAGWPP